MKEIQELLNLLPHNSPIIAGKLLANKKFNELSILVADTLVEVKKAQKKKQCPEEYKSIEFNELLRLKTLIDNYNINSLYEEV